MSATQATSPLPSLYSRGRRQRFNFGDLFTFAVPATACVMIQSVGILFASDALAVLAFPVLFARYGLRLARKLPKQAILLALIWLGAQVLTDFVRETPFADWSRGWSKVGLTLVHFCVAYLLISHSTRRVRIYAVGLFVGIVGGWLANPTRGLGDPWKFSLATPVTLVVTVLASLLVEKRRYGLAIALVACTMVPNFALGVRSQSLISLLATAAIVTQVYSRTLRNKLGRRYVIVALAVAVIGVFAVVQVYTFGSESGWYSKEQQAKFREQSQGMGGVILGGRSEILASSLAIAESPILGHGSWARDPRFALMLAERRRALGFKVRAAEAGDLIPTHSHLFGAWVEAGIAGALFWGWVCWQAGTLFRLDLRNEVLLPIVAFIAPMFVWDILFSPFGAERRFVNAFFIAVILFVHERYRARQSYVQADFNRYHLV